MQFPKATEMAHQLVAARVKKRNCVIDATAGNGHDTLFLARAVGNGGKVFAIDVQELAIASTRQRIEASEVSKPVEYFCRNHMEMKAFIPAGKHGKVKAVMFNLGYLPGGDKELTTDWSSSLKAIRAALELVSEDGIVTIVVYPGHPAGAVEANAVERFAEQLDAEEFCVAKYGLMRSAQGATAPYLMAIARR